MIIHYVKVFLAKLPCWSPSACPHFEGRWSKVFYSPRSPLTYAVFAKHQLQQQQCERAAETSLYLNINIIELFLWHGAGFQSQRLFRQRHKAIKKEGICRKYSQVAFKLATVIRNTVNRATFWPI